MDQFKGIALSGGGVKGLAQLGALHYFYENGKYNPKVVHTYIGTSIGSAISLLLVCGYAPMDIFAEVYKVDKLLDTPQKESLWIAFEKSGLFPIEVFTDKVLELVEKKMGNVPTLLELKKRTGKTLITTSVNVTKGKLVYFSPETRPNLCCIDAVRMSCNLPCIFHQIIWEGDIYTDGGLASGFPINYIDDGVISILGIVVLGTESPLANSTFLGYLYRLINMPVNTIINLQCRDLGPNVTLVKIKCQNIPILQFSMKSEDKTKLMVQGYHKANFIDRLQPIEVDGWPEGWDFNWDPFGGTDSGVD